MYSADWRGPIPTLIVRVALGPGGSTVMARTKLMWGPLGSRDSSGEEIGNDANEQGVRQTPGHGPEPQPTGYIRATGLPVLRC